MGEVERAGCYCMDRWSVRRIANEMATPIRRTVSLPSSESSLPPLRASSSPHGSVKGSKRRPEAASKSVPFIGPGWNDASSIHATPSKSTGNIAGSRPGTSSGNAQRPPTRAGASPLSRSWDTAAQNPLPVDVLSGAHLTASNSARELWYRSTRALEENSIETRMQLLRAAGLAQMARAQSTPLISCSISLCEGTFDITRMFVGSTVSFNLSVRYSFSATGNIATEDIDQWVYRSGAFHCMLFGPIQLKADIKHVGHGTYTVSYSPNVAGDFQVHLTLGSRHIDGSPFPCSVTAGATEPNNTEVTGIGLLCGESGKEQQFEIKCKDRFMNLRTSGGDDVRVSLIGPISLDAGILDRRNGTYIAKYNTLICGEYRVYVVVNKIQVPSCPYTLAIVAGKSYAPASTCSGKNLLRAIAGEGSQFKIQAYDVAGNIRILGGDLFETVLQGPATIRATVLDLDDGTYQVEYIPTHSGVYELHVTLGALHCQGSPFRLEVAPSLVVPVRCCAFGKALEEAFVGLECVFTVEARDKHKNRLQSGGCDFVVNARGPLNVKATVVDLKNGHYNCCFSTSKSGVYFISVLCNAVDIEGSPFRISVQPGPTNAQGTTCTGPGLQGGYLGQPCSFEIQSRDQFGNKRFSGMDDFRVTISGTGRPDVNIHDTGTGVYIVTYVPTVGGDYYINVTHMGKEVAGSPFLASFDPVPKDALLQIFKNIKDVSNTAVSGAEDAHSRQSEFKGNVLKALDVGQSNAESLLLAKQGQTSDEAAFWVLYVKILGARNLVSRDTEVQMSASLSSLSQSASSMFFTFSSDPYAVLSVGKQKKQTSVIRKSLNPVWNETLIFDIHDRMQKLELQIFDHDDDDGGEGDGEQTSMGDAVVSLLPLVENVTRMQWVQLKHVESGQVQLLLTLKQSDIGARMISEAQ